MEEIAHVRGKVIAIVAAADGRSTVPRAVADGVVALWALPPDSAHGEVTNLLTCDSFAYPLMGQPCLRASPLTYVLSCAPGGEVKNYVLSLCGDEDVPGHEEDVNEFCACLERLTTTRVRAGANPVAGSAIGGAGAVAAAPSAITSAPSQTHLPPPATTRIEAAGTGVSRGIISLGGMARSALVAGAGLAGRGVQVATEAIAKKLGRSSKPLEVSAANRARLGQARVLTRTAVVVTASMVEGAVALAKSLSTAAAAAIAETETGKKLAASAATPTGQAVKGVANASLIAFRDVWDGMEEAAQKFGGATAGATRTLVTSRYGEEALPIANDAIGLASDIGAVALQSRNLTVGGLVRRTAAETATTLVQNTGNHAAPQLTNGTA